MKDIKIIRSIYFDYELFQKLQKVAEKNNVSRSKIVNDAIKQYIDKIKKDKK